MSEGRWVLGKAVKGGGKDGQTYKTFIVMILLDQVCKQNW